VDAPLTEEWIIGLDSDLKNNPTGRVFSKYLKALKDSGLEQVSDIADSSVEDLIKYGTMTLGDARRVLAMAKMECEKLLNSKRARN
jgi:hypothetical protein